MFKNVASQKAICFAFDATTGLPKSGDSANITAYVSKDYGAVTVLGDTSATEMDSTNAKGYYLFDLTQAETNADTLLFSAKSSTSNIVVIGAPAIVFTIPASWTIPRVTLTDTLTTYTGNTVQTGDSYARLGAPAGASIAADLVEIEGETDGIAAIPTNPYTGTPPTAAQIATAFWQDLTASADFTTAGSIGKLIVTTGLTVLSVTNGVTLAASQHVIVDSGAVTTLTNLPAITAGWLTAAGIAAAALNGKGDWSTYAGGDTSGTTTLLSRIPGTVQPQTGDSYARLGVPAGASVSADVAAINSKTTNLPAAPADETLVIAATNAIMSRLGAPAGASIAADVAGTPAALLDLASAVEGLTPRQLARLLASVLVGKSTNGGTHYRDLADTKDRIAATVDASNNRTAVTRDAT